MGRPKKTEPVKYKHSTKARVKRMVGQGKSERDIANRLGLSKTSVHYYIQALREDPSFLAFQKDKAEILEGLQLEIYRAIDPDIIKSMLLKRGLTDLAILQDKIALLRGQPTSISDIDLRGLIALVSNGSVPPSSGGDFADKGHESLETLCDSVIDVDTNDPR